VSWSVLQSATGAVAGSGNCTVTPSTASLSSGSKLIVVVSLDSNTVTVPTTVKDAAANSFTSIGSVAYPSGQGGLSFWALDTPAGDAGLKPVITCTNGTNFGAVAGLLEVAGLQAGSTTAILDGTAGHNTGTASPATITGGTTYSSATAGEFLLGMAGDAGYGSTYTLSGYSSAVNSGSSNSAQLVAGYGNSTGGLESLSWAISGATTWGLLLVAFKLAAPPPSLPPAPQPGSASWRRWWRRPQQPVPSSLPPPVMAGLAAAAGSGLDGQASTPAPPSLPAQPGGVFFRHRWRNPNIPWYRFIDPPVITGTAGGANGYFTDQYGTPRLVWGDAAWALCGNVGRWTSGAWQADYDTYLATRQAQGVNVVYTKPMGTTQSGNINDQGVTFDGLYPFQGGAPSTGTSGASPSSGLTEAYWQRIDYFLASARAKGICVFLNAIGYDSDFSSGPGPLFGKSAAEFTAYGTALGNRYKGLPNLVWNLADDYFGENDALITAFMTGVRAAGDAHVVSIENNPETTSRLTLDGNNTHQAWGFANAQYNFVYSYQVIYYGVELAYSADGTVPVIAGDGYFYQGGSSYVGGSSFAFDRNFRQESWWALSSGARGKIHGDEGVWEWPATAQNQAATGWFWKNSALAIRTAFEGLPGWQNLLPDTASQFITSGRGTHSTYTTSQYESSTTDAYVTGSITPDGSLAVVYLSHATTITVNQALLNPGYTATWIDPVNGATSPAATGTTYNSTAKGSNSQGDPDWVLAFQGPPAQPAVTAPPVQPGSDLWQRRYRRQQQAIASPAATVPATTAPAGLAAGTGAALDTPLAVVTAVPGLATGTGAALDTPLAVAAAPAGLAAGTGTSQAPGAQVTAAPGLAAGTGTSQPPGAQVIASAGLAAGTGTSQPPGAQVIASAGLAAGTGTSQPPGAQVIASAGLAAGTGASQAPGALAIASTGLATGTGTAQAPGAQVTVSAGLAAGTGTALAPSASTSGNTTANAGLAAGAGTSQAPGAQVTAQPGLATGTGTAQPPVATAATASGLASGTGTAQAPAAQLAAAAGLVTGAGTAQLPAVQDAVSAGLAPGAGTAQQPAVALTPGTAVSAGTSQPPGAQVTVLAGLASGTGAALTATASTSGSTTASAGLATGAGTAQSPGAQAVAAAGLGAGTGTAQPPVPGRVPGLPAGTGAALSPVAQAAEAPGLGAGTGAAQPPVASVTASAALATGAGTAQAAVPARTPVLAAATAAALAAAAVVTARAQLASSLAVAPLPAVSAAANVIKGYSAGASVTPAASSRATVTFPGGGA